MFNPRQPIHSNSSFCLATGSGVDHDTLNSTIAGIFVNKGWLKSWREHAMIGYDRLESMDHGLQSELMFVMYPGKPWLKFSVINPYFCIPAIFHMTFSLFTQSIPLPAWEVIRHRGSVIRMSLIPKITDKSTVCASFVFCFWFENKGNI